jgi:hypothetical protein
MEDLRDRRLRKKKAGHKMKEKGLARNFTAPGQ